MHARRWSLCSVVVALAVLVACTDDSNTAATTSSSTPATSSTVVAAADDGILKIGAVLPSGGAAADMGVSMRAALQLAVTQINEAGGVNGRPISVTVRDEGDSAATALGAVQDLVHGRSDVIIGPTSSLNLLATLSATVAQHVLTCAPTASALSLDDYPAQGLLVRTVPSDSLQAQAIARTVDQFGSNKAAIAYLDDAYGRPFAEVVARALRDRGTTVTGQYPFEAGRTPTPATVDAVTSADPDVVVVVADSVTGPEIVTAIDAATSADGLTFVVNDALRRPGAATTPYPKALAAKILGVSPMAYAEDATFTDALHVVDPSANGLYAVNAYDCLNLVALAAAATHSDDARMIAAAIAAVSNGGSSCATYADCQVIAANGRNPNYDGPNGALAIDETGTTSSATFEKFRFDAATGRDVRSLLVTVGNP